MGNSILEYERRKKNRKQSALLKHHNKQCVENKLFNKTNIRNVQNVVILLLSEVFHQIVLEDVIVLIYFFCFAKEGISIDFDSVLLIVYILHSTSTKIFEQSPAIH